MSKITDEPKCESALVAREELVENSKNTMINPSKEFLEIFSSSYIFSRTPNELNKKQIRIMETKINKLFHKATNSGNTKFDDVVTIAHAYLNICRVYILSDEKEKLHIAKDNVLHCLTLLKDKELDCKAILLALSAYNFLGSIYNKQKKIEKAILTYDKAVELYFMFIQEHFERGFVNLKDVGNMPPAKLHSYKELQNIYILILQSLIGLHTYIGPTNNHCLITCSHMLLAAELNILSESKKALSWIQTAMTLYNYFLMCNRFREARNHLNAAAFVKEVFIDEVYKNTRKSAFEVDDLNEQSNIAFILITMHRARYGVVLLRRSIERLLWLEKEDFETDNIKSESPTNSKKQVSQKLLLFPQIEEEYSNSNVYQPVMAKYISNYTGAKEIFVMILRLLSDRRLNISVDKDIKTSMIIVQDICNAYKYMALYEHGICSRTLLHNRRLEILSNAINSVRKSNCNVLKHLRLQLAIVYSTLVDMNIENIPFASLYTQQRHDTINAKIDDLLAKGLMNLQKYMQSE